MGKKQKINKDKPTTIYFFRHGQPDNPKKMIKGVSPFKLSSLGKKQVQKQAKGLKDSKIGMVFSSPVLRCQQTAAIIADQLSLPMCQNDSSGVRLPAQGLKIKTTTHLTEWTGSLDGKPEKECKKLPMAKYNTSFEPKEKVIKRMTHFVKMILEKCAGQNIVAVSHQGPIDLFLASVQGKSIKDMPYKGLTTPMAGINKAEFDHQANLLSALTLTPDVSE